jgi:chromosome segregation ATPase
MWSEVGLEVGEAREAELRDRDMFFKPALDKRARLLRHHNTLESAQAIVQCIIENRPMALQIQHELVDRQMDISQTAAGTELNRELMEQARKHRQELREIQAEMQAAIKAKDEETRQELEEEARKLKAEMLRVQTDSQRLASDYNEEKARMEQKMQEMVEAASRTAAEYQRQMEALDKQLQDAAKSSAAEKDSIQKQMDDLQRRYESDRNQGGCTIF